MFEAMEQVANEKRHAPQAHDVSSCARTNPFDESR
jgi:hypothetical protein